MKIELSYEPIHEARNWQRALIVGNDGITYGIQNDYFPHNVFLSPWIEIQTTSHYNDEKEAIDLAKKFGGKVKEEIYGDGFFVAFNDKDGGKIHDKFTDWLAFHSGYVFSWK
jgi:hypothetical protein